MSERKAPVEATTEAHPSANLITAEHGGSAASEQARKRPGVSDAYLEQADVRHVDAEEAYRLCGRREPGLWIPYPGCDGYGRLRLDNPKGGPKYHQAKGSDVHAFLPRAAQRPVPGADLVLIEGEFKALALCEAGIPAIGVSGFYGWRRGERLVPELQALIDRTRPSRVLFAGDSDTALNEQFSDAAVQLAGLVDVPVLLPRLPIDGPKAWDDLRESLELDDDKLRERWQEAVGEAVEVDPGMHTGELAVELLRPEQRRLKAGRDAGLGERKVRERLVKIGAVAKKAGGMVFDQAVDVVAQAGIAKRIAFKADVKRLEEKRREEAAQREASEGPAFDEEKADAIAARFVFDGHCYYERNGDRYDSIARKDDVMMRLAGLGASRKVQSRGEDRSPAEEVLERIQRERRAAYAGPLCGRPAGVHEEGGQLVLATDSPAFVEGSGKREDGPLTTFVAQLLADDPTQFLVFMAWLKRARQALRNPEQHLPGQALVLVGPPDCGKTLFQSIITWCLGGRDVDASSVLDGTQARFTAHLFKAEHLVASDLGTARSHNAQHALRERLKQFVANERIEAEGKHKTSVTLRPVWRITISANDNADSVGILPSPLEDASFADKVSIFLCRRPSILPTEDASEEERARFKNSLLEDLPNLLAMADEAETPTELQKARFGVKEYVNPKVQQLLEAASSDGPIVEIVSDYLERHGRFQGTAGDLLKALKNDSGLHVGEHITNERHLTCVLQRMAGRDRWKGLVKWKHDWNRHRNLVAFFDVRYGSTDSE